MGCPVPKVCKTGRRRGADRRPRHRGRGRPRGARGQRPAGHGQAAQRPARRATPTASISRTGLSSEAGVSRSRFHPRSAGRHHKGKPDYALAARARERRSTSPVILSGGLRDRERSSPPTSRPGAAAVMLARGSLGNPWLFEHVLGRADERADPRRGPRRARLADRPRRRAPRPERAARYLRKFYPWYLDRLGAPKSLQAALQQARSLAEAHSSRGACARAGRLNRTVPAARLVALAYAPPRWSAPSQPGTFAMMPKDVILTPEGLEKLKEELEDLRTDRRRDVAERIKEAREFGDISENSEYDDAKNEQAMLETADRPARGDARAGERHRRPRHRHRDGRDRLRRARQGREDRQVDEVHDRRLGRGQPVGAASSPTSRPSGAPCSGTSATRSSRSRCRAAPRASSRSPRSTSG